MRTNRFKNRIPAKLRILILAAAALMLLAACAAAPAAQPAPDAPSASGASSAPSAPSSAAASAEEPAQSAPAGQAAAIGPQVPSAFTFSGGSGKVSITCPEAFEDADGYRIRLCFSSPNYEYVRMGDAKYEREEDSGDESSCFVIPAEPDTDITILAMTTAMSKPHEIEYRIRYSLEEEAAPGETPVAAKYDTEAAEYGPDAAESARALMERTAGELGLAILTELEPRYAEQFSGCVLEGGAKLLCTGGGQRLLILSGGAMAPENMPADLILLERPADRIYAAATAVPALFDAAGALPSISFVGTDKNGWDIDAPVRALSEGSMIFAGRYSAPDYELLVSEGCRLAVESTMIGHSPEAGKKLESLGIPVLVDLSSYEKDPAGRMEWVRFYGWLTGHEEEAETFFKEQEKILSGYVDAGETGQTIAVFSIRENGTVVVRRPGDYITAMIGKAGAGYALEESLKNVPGASSSLSISMEEFYRAARDVDHLIYNATIGGSLSGIDDLEEKNDLFAGFKAVQEGHVWQYGGNFYQASDCAYRLTGDLIDIQNGRVDDLVFLEKLGRGSEGGAE